jgi:ferrochelatase
MSTYDALLVVSFGGPEGREEVMPFLENVLRGRRVPRERMLAVAEHYYAFDGFSPINGQNKALIAALEQELAAHHIDLPIYWGNRNWHPLLPDTMAQMKTDGIQRALVFLTSAYSSYSNCRQYRENISDAQASVGEGAPEIEKLRAFFNHPGFINTMTARMQEAFGQIPEARREATSIIYTAHSIPSAMAAGCAYEAQLQETARLVSHAMGYDRWSLAYQSRSGAPHQPWLEPDVCDYIKHLHDTEKPQDIILVPIGFISDHMEVRYDLDVEARQVSDDLGINMVRASTTGTHPRFINMIRELIEERLSDASERQTLGDLSACPDVCPEDCCLSGSR